MENFNQFPTNNNRVASSTPNTIPDPRFYESDSSSEMYSNDVYLSSATTDSLLNISNPYLFNQDAISEPKNAAGEEYLPQIDHGDWSTDQSSAALVDYSPISEYVDSPSGVEGCSEYGNCSNLSLIPEIYEYGMAGSSCPSYQIGKLGIGPESCNNDPSAIYSAIPYMVQSGTIVEGHKRPHIAITDSRHPEIDNRNSVK
ncbi:hypothetical protein CDAR_3511 [Caerostris darwini]|uniref:Uncharacterized protein n=1 Tax=Caerostris darwini TaxID=1538125 RepID=A0AAV4WL93_9ARAC|nr:hypothetical protein CDAR_3511 [Caerostris darwini]